MQQSQYPLPFPDQLLPPEQKETAEYGLQVARAIQDMMVRGNTYPSYGIGSWYDMLKLYAQGQQPEWQYQNAYRGIGTFVSRSNPNGNCDTPSGNNQTGGQGFDDGEFLRKGLQNVNYKIFAPPIPKLLSIYKALLNEADMMIDVQSISKDAMNKKALKKWKTYYASVMINPMLIENGMQPIKLDWYPQTIPELETYEKYHGFKLKFEAALLKILKHTFYISKWDEIFDKFKETAAENAFICSRVTVNDQGAVVIEQINPKYYITSFREDQSLEDPPFAAHIKAVPLSNIIPVLKEKGMTDEQIMAVAKSNASINGFDTTYDYSYRDPATNRYKWYDWSVNVLHFEIRSNDESRYRKYQKKNGEYRYVRENAQVVATGGEKTEYKYKPGNNPNTEETDIYRNQCVYEGDWVFGTECLLYYGRQKNILKNSDGSAALSYVHYHIPGMPLVERWQPEADQFQMSALKLQADILAARPDGFVIDMAIMANMSALGFGKLTGPKIQKILRETGNLYVQTTDTMYRNKINAANAVIPIQGGLPESSAAWLALMDNLVRIMRETAGITDAVAAGSDKKPELVGIMKGEMIATSNALYTYKRGLIYAKEELAKKVIAKARMLVKYNPKSREYYSDVIGEDFVREMDLFDDLSLNQIGIIMRAAPTAERKLELSEYVKLAMTPTGKSGETQIDLSDAMFIREEIEQGYFESAQSFISIAIQRKQQARAAQAAREQQQNAQVQIQSAQAAEKAKAETDALLIQLESDADLKKEAQKGQIQLAVEREKHLNRMREIALQGHIDEKKQVETAA